MSLIVILSVDVATTGYYGHRNPQTTGEEETIDEGLPADKQHDKNCTCLVES